jgi:Uma2 family endonuclease
LETVPIGVEAIEMSVGTISGENSVVLHNATWQTYINLRDSDENYRVRMTYDQGDLEIMSPSNPHERLAYLIGRFIDIWTLEKRIPIQSGRSTTFRRKDLRRGLEPDNCYYIEHEADVRSREEIDLTIDPPPDLAIEVDVTSKSIDRLPIYAALGVPEIWRWCAEKLHVLRLNSKEQYTEVAASQALRGFPVTRMVELIKLRTSSNETTLLRRFQTWCKRRKKA